MRFQIGLIMGGLFGAAGVGVGAYAAHGAGAVMDPRDVALLETASMFAILHAVALVALVGIAKDRKSRVLTIASALFIGGLVLFSGGITISAFAPDLSAPTAPVGGVCFILGWLAVAVFGFGAFPQKSSEVG
ncbi:MAG: DUF423 domain-containing protein [Alphaproteobacteria bacterium]